MKMSILKPVNTLLAVVILLYSITCVYNAPTGSVTCGSGEPLPEGDQASRYDDALYVANRIIVSYPSVTSAHLKRKSAEQIHPN